MFSLADCRQRQRVDSAAILPFHGMRRERARDALDVVLEILGIGVPAHVQDDNVDGHALYAQVFLRPQHLLDEAQFLALLAGAAP